MVENKVNLTNYELLKSFAEINEGDLYLDLHNDFDCKSIKFNHQGDLVLFFNACEKNYKHVEQIAIVFKDVIISRMDFMLNDCISGWTLDTIYRGRFENKKGGLDEKKDGRSYYYIDFLNSYSFELFANSVTANITYWGE